MVKPMSSRQCNRRLILLAVVRLYARRRKR